MSDLPKPMPPPSAPMMIPIAHCVVDDPVVGNHHDEQQHQYSTTSTPEASSYQNELLRQGYTPGLITAIQKNRIAFAHCFWIIDNSGSMQTQDGHRIITSTATSSIATSSHSTTTTNHTLQFVTCSRWKEMVQTVEYHINMAALIHAPTTFRLLNHPGRQAGSQIFSIATTVSTTTAAATTAATATTISHQIDHDLAVALNIIHQTQPNGVTPLTEHIIAIRHAITNMVPQLQARGQKVAIVLATDGLPTDTNGNSNPYINQQFRDALQSLEGLPIWIVVRLCTDEESIVNFWNELDTELEINLEVLDDYVSEGQEIYKINPWLTYGLPLHRMREMGFYHRIFDLLDEQPLSKSDVRDFVHLLFGPFDTPDPDLDWDQFCTAVQHIQQQQQYNKVLQWNPVLQKLMPWIDIRKLRQHNNIKSSNSWFGFW